MSNFFLGQSVLRQALSKPSGPVQPGPQDPCTEVSRHRAVPWAGMRCETYLGREHCLLSREEQRCLTPIGFHWVCSHLVLANALISTVTATAYIIHSKLVAVVLQNKEGTAFAWKPKLANTLPPVEWMGISRLQVWPPRPARFFLATRWQQSISLQQAC